jgi:hypothetical protein
VMMMILKWTCSVILMTSADCCYEMSYLNTEFILHLWKCGSKIPFLAYSWQRVLEFWGHVLHCPGSNLIRRSSCLLVTTYFKSFNWTLSIRVKRKGREADRSSPSSPEFKNAWYCNSTAPSAFTTCRRANILSPPKRNLVLVHARRLCGRVEVEVYSFSVSRLYGRRDQLHAPTALPSEKESLVIEHCM